VEGGRFNDTQAARSFDISYSPRMDVIFCIGKESWRMASLLFSGSMTREEGNMDDGSVFCLMNVAVSLCAGDPSSVPFSGPVPPSARGSVCL